MLVDTGYIRKDIRFCEKNRRQTSNLYTLILFENIFVSDDDSSFRGENSIDVIIP